MTTLTQERTINIFGDRVHSSLSVRSLNGEYAPQLVDRNKTVKYTGISGWLALMPEQPGEGEMAPATVCSGGAMACPCKSVI